MSHRKKIGFRELNRRFRENTTNGLYLLIYAILILSHN